MKEEHKTRFTWFIEVPEALFLELEEKLKHSRYKTKAEFIRTAVREKLTDI